MMNKRNILQILLLFACNSFLLSQNVAWFNTGGIFVNSQETVATMMDVAGVPLYQLRNSDLMHEYDLLFMVDCSSHSGSDSYYLDKYYNYIEGGGVLFSDYYSSNNNYGEVFGLSSEVYSKHYEVGSFNISKEDDWINSENEFVIPLAASGIRPFAVYEILPTTASVFASYEDSTVAITRNTIGEGVSYFFGPSWKRLVTFPRNNRDLSAQRSYSNGFEPGADIIPLLIRGIIEDHFPVTVWKHTLPKDYKSALVITHDVDKANSYENAQSFIDYELENNIPAHYFVGTKYVDDASSGPLYNEYKGKELLNTLLDAGFTVGSNGVGGFTDFEDEDVFPLGTSDVTTASYSPFYNGDSTSGGTVLGEVLASKQILERDGDSRITSFRSGRLRFNKYLPTGLQIAQYAAESSFRANDVMTGFPYFLQKDLSSTEPLVDVLEIPVHISDAVDYLNADEYSKAVDIWEDVIGKCSDNYAPVTLAIDPDKDYKLAALDELLQRIKGKTELINFEELNAFWRERRNLTYKTSLDSTNKVLTITIPESVLPISDNQSLHITKGKSLDSIIVVSEAGMAIDHTLLDWDEESYLLRFVSAANDFVVRQTGITCLELKAEFSLSDPSYSVDSLLWYFGDGEVQMVYDNIPLKHIYTTEGQYEVTLDIYAHGVRSKCSQVFDVQLAPAPSAYFDVLVSDTTYGVPLEAHFSSALSGDDSGHCLWKISQGDFEIESSDRDFQYLFTSPGIYSITLQTENSLGCTNRYERMIEVQPYEFGVHAFDVATYPKVCGALEADFVVAEELGVDYDSLVWDFGDGQSVLPTSLNEVTHFYTTEGTYNVQLTVWRYGAQTTIEKPCTVFVPELPRANFTYEVADMGHFAPLTVYFQNTSLSDAKDTLSCKWSFYDDGEMQEKTADHFLHVFEQPGFYPITLEASGLCGAVSQRDSFILVKDPLQIDEVEYIVGDCNETCPMSGVNYRISNDTLIVFGSVEQNCCSYKTAVVSDYQDTIKITTFETYENGEACTCLCDYCFEISIPNFNRAECALLFDDQSYHIENNTRLEDISSSVRIVPNPTHDYLRIQVDGNYQNISAVFYDLQGNKLSETTFINQPIEVPIESGVCILRLMLDDELVLKKIVKL